MEASVEDIDARSLPQNLKDLQESLMTAPENFAVHRNHCSGAVKTKASIVRPEKPLKPTADMIPLPEEVCAGNSIDYKTDVGKEQYEKLVGDGTN
ncbi:hypothetical protein Bca4012_075510 [Brassica carinata]